MRAASVDARHRPPSRQILTRFARAVRDIVMSEVGTKVRLLFAGLIALSLAINALNVVNSYVGRDFMTAIEQRSRAEFVRMALLYASVFAVSTVVAVFFRFIEERLGLVWREWLTRRAIEQYLGHAAYLRLRERGELANPDQRIADDARAFATSTLSFALMWLNGTFTILAFASVLWSISPLLFGVAVAYAGVGSALTIAFGRPLVRLNYDQADREASFRAELVHLRENAESVALLQREGRLGARLRRRLDALIGNARRIIGVNRNLSFFTTGYNYGIQLIPALIIGPLFIRGDVEFGVITQSAMAFSHLLGAFSLVVTQFQGLSSYAAVLARLDGLVSALEEARWPEASSIESSHEGERFAYEKLTLVSRRSDDVLVNGLDVVISAGARVLVSGPEEAQLALFRATAGFWEIQQGRIVRPPAERMLFLPERPYLPPGTLREALLHTGRESRVADAEIASVIESLRLESVVARLDGLDVERDWDEVLSLSEQQLVSTARILLAKPAVALFQDLGSTIAPELVDRILALSSAASITAVVFGKSAPLAGNWDAVLELRAGGAWTWRESRPGA